MQHGFTELQHTESSTHRAKAQAMREFAVTLLIRHSIMATCDQHYQPGASSGASCAAASFTARAPMHTMPPTPLLKRASQMS